MIKESFGIFNRHLLSIIWLSLLIVMPLTLFLYIAMVYIYQFAEADQYPSLYALFLIILNFTLVIPIFNQIAKDDSEDEEQLSLLQLLLSFVTKFGIILFVSLPLYLIGTMGTIFLFIPTVVCGVLILLFPFFVDESSIRGMFHQVGRVLKTENIFLLLDILIIVCTQLLAFGLMTMLFSNFENNLFAYGFGRAFVNALTFPVLVFYLTLRYKKEKTTGL